MSDGIFSGTKNRLLQILARFSPGATTLRVRLHQSRGVKIGKGVWIGYDAILETAYPHLISIGDYAEIGIRSTIIAHHNGPQPVTIQEEAFIGPGCIILPNSVIGHGAVVTAGSVVTASVPPKTVVQGNPAKPVAKCEVPLIGEVSLKEFSRGIRPYRP